MPVRARATCAALAAALLLALPAPGLRAQEAETRAPEPFAAGRVQSPILTIESDRLFAESAFGRRIAREIEAERTAITEENDRITEELTAEEQRLTDLRGTIPADEFQALADAFDTKVQNLRNEQEEKARAIGTRGEEARRRFLNAAQPVIGEIMRETGAALIVERRIVFISADVIDITDSAIQRIDASLGEGSADQP
ncbi:OmpH family outer membrane protein [Thalassococcus profundi]|uniref:OmpH family outer membrane protein n=1 Tax=Thalassococcus profundi TaxID=2282382 RepID=A0A369TNF7_9RHOB|nr:OmpH family outer membrane protein [Thalassococcus profundi]RDD66803.1 OmpH family outer membrane protein [Thalassococcus profundi]